MGKWIGLAVGGVAGTFARHVVGAAVHHTFGQGFPYGTLTVNLLGCFIIGMLAGLSELRWQLDPNMRLLLVIGFCGAFTTFSSFMLETATLLQAGSIFKAALNVVASLLVGFLCFWAGIRLGGSF